MNSQLLSVNPFLLESRIILIAKDRVEKEHSWKIIEGDNWERIYIVPLKNALHHFIID